MDRPSKQRTEDAQHEIHKTKQRRRVVNGYRDCIILFWECIVLPASVRVAVEIPKYENKIFIFFRYWYLSEINCIPFDHQPITLVVLINSSEVF
jgi:hypothetical protein